VGLAAIQLAVEAGATAIATASQEKHAQTQAAGALASIDYKKGGKTAPVNWYGGLGTPESVFTYLLMIVSGELTHHFGHDDDDDHAGDDAAAAADGAGDWCAGPFVGDVSAATAGQGVSLVLDCVGAAYFQQVRLTLAAIHDSAGIACRGGAADDKRA
jgi:NADPH:quinone reductase-like Zn-dependent oxidoreductase